MILAGIGLGVDHFRTPEVTNAIGITMEYRRDGLLTAFGRAVVVALETVVGGRDKTGMNPATVARESGQPVDRGVGHDHEVEAGGLDMFGRAIEAVDQRAAGRARRVLLFELCRLARFRRVTGVRRISREHEAVGDQGLCAWPEQFGKLDL